LKKIHIAYLIALVNIFFINASFGQNQNKYKTYNQENFENNKILDQVYHLWWYKNKWFPNAKDTLPYFVDDRNYKGIVNYGVTFRNRDFTTFHLIENLSMCFLKVEFTKCNYNPLNNVIDIEGFVNGGPDRGKAQRQIEIFLGEKTDTINSCYFGKVVDTKITEAKLNNIEINEFTILDKFQSFYLKKIAYCTTTSEGRRPFKISGKVTPKTLLTFGGTSYYTEIFDVGSMIYYPSTNKPNKIVKREELDCRPIIVKNRLVVDTEKEQKQNINYYTYTQNAENFLIIKQYAKAKEQYSLLFKNYPSAFARDIHNAIRCAILSRDIKTAFLWSEKLAFKGINLPYFNSKIFAGMRKNIEWKSFSIKYDSIYKLTKSNWNLKLKEELNNLLNEDQADYGLENRKSPKILYETTDRVTDKLIYLLKNEGFPSEEKIGSFIKNDTILVTSPDYNVLLRHATQQRPKNLNVLKELLDNSIHTLEYDSKRSPNNTSEYDSCFHVYKGNLYNSKSCGKNELILKKIAFKFNNPINFIIDNNDYIITDYDKANHVQTDKYYEENFTFIMKLTDDWEFYEE
jgi:hypothetical protein